MPIPISQVDAFTNQPFGGNPAAVCVTPEPLPEPLMQCIALEMNLSETAFLHPITDGFSLRWFTPTVEVDLCGHATLASAHVLWSEGHLAPAQTARFHTRSGLLSARKQQDWIELNFPSQPVQAMTEAIDFASILGTQAILSAHRNSANYLVELSDQATVAALKPDFAAISQLQAQGIIVTSIATQAPYDFVSRYFAPAAGIPEDPVTGSAHCSLAPYWHSKLEKSDFLAYQASLRGGILKVSYQGERTHISGQAITVLQGQLLV
jgi:PhzF family phenazine biosynthesis protein